MKLKKEEAYSEYEDYEAFIVADSDYESAAYEGSSAYINDIAHSNNAVNSDASNSEEYDYLSDEEYEKRVLARKARVEAAKKRQLLYRKLFVGGIGVILVGLIVIIIAISTSKKGNASNQNVVNKPDASSESDASSKSDASSEQTDMIDQISPAQAGAVIFLETKEALMPEPEPEAVISEVVTETGCTQQFSLDSQKYSFEKSSGATYMGSDEFTSAYGIMVCLDDNKVIAQKNCYDIMYPASMTKVMTVLTARQYITDEELDNYVTVTQDCTDYSFSNGCSAVGFSVGEAVTVRDLFYGTILHSGADAAYMLAVYVAGTHEAFVDLMNDNINALGISGTTHFTNCVGIFNSNHFTTSYDMAVIMAATMEDEFLRDVMKERIYRTSSTIEHPDGIEISNLFIRRIEDFETMGTVAGAKTGFVNQSLNCAVSFMYGDDGKSYICVSGGAQGSWRAIYDHIAAYNIYAMNNTSFVRTKKATK